MYTDRYAVREIDKKVRYSHYDQQRINEILDRVPLQEATLLYKALLIGLDIYEREYGISGDNEAAKEGLANGRQAAN